MMFKFLSIPVLLEEEEGLPFFGLPALRETEGKFTMFGQVDDSVALTEHPDPWPPDGKTHGPGRLQLRKDMDARYASVLWRPWWGCSAGYTLGEDDETLAVSAVWLRRMSKKEFWWRLRRGEGRGRYLGGARLRGAYLKKADFRGTWLPWSDLRSADLRYADLRGADLSGADLFHADLSGARYDQNTIWPTGFMALKEAMFDVS